ncbi:hypothetical protein HDU85_004308 [Gaertneriomyces sp. JEL0708]|nr:hypothetical protein HDU85_004308 [Gaertneriomyces sp. JEL0708]
MVASNAKPWNWVFVLICLVSCIAGAIAGPIPSSQVKVDSFRYANGRLTGYVYVQNIAYEKKLEIIYSTSSGVWNKPENKISAYFYAPVPNSNYELWTFSTRINDEGIAQFYVKLSSGQQSFYDNNNSQNYAVSGVQLPFENPLPASVITPWQNRTIYQIITDRFAGDNVSDCADMTTYCGGNFQGIIDHLDYIQNLGFDAIWISPVQENRPDGYHGYWATDFYKINPQFGDAAKLKELVSEAHKRSMYVIVDVVANHVGVPAVANDYTGYTLDQPWMYHKPCAIDYGVPQTVENCWILGLPDVDTENEQVVQKLNEIVSWTVKEFGFDGIRLDTVKHVRPDFWFEYVRAAGVWATGEVFSGDAAFLASYQPDVPSLLNFPLYFSARNAYGAKASFQTLARDIESFKKTFKSLAEQTTFLDNHDNPRFLSMYPDTSLYWNAVTFTLLVEGIPSVYYGMEHEFNGGVDPLNREPMWTSGYNAYGKGYKLIRTLINDVRRKTGQDVQFNVFVTDDLYVFRRGDALVVTNHYGQGVNRSVSVNVGQLFQDGRILKDVLSGRQATVQGGRIQVEITNGMPVVYM